MSEQKEDFSGWIICGVGGDTFVGKPVIALIGDDAPGSTMALSPCYAHIAHMIQVPQVEMGRTVGINLVMQEQVASPSNAPCDVTVKLKPSWIIKPSSDDTALLNHIERLVRIARDQQLAARSAAAGIQRAGRLTT